MLKLLINRIENTPDRRIGLYLFIVTFIVRFGYSLNAYSNNIMSNFVDDKFYFRVAIEIVNQGKIFYETYQPIYDIVGPSLGWINALTIYVFGENWLGIFFVTSVISALLTLLTYAVALKVTNKSSAFLAAIWSCFYLLYFKFTPTAGKDILMSFFLIASIYFLIRLFYEIKFSYSVLVLFALVYVYSFHLDERFIIFAPVFFIFIFASGKQTFSKTKILRAIIFVALIILLMLPWGIRNYAKYDKIVLISTRTERITDKILGYESRKNIFDHLYDENGPYYIYDYQIDSVLNGSKKITDGGYKISEAQRQAMIAGNMPHKFTFLEASWSRFASMFKPVQFGGVWERNGYFYYEKSFSHNLTSFCSYGIILFFSLPGFYFLFKKNRYVFYLFASTIIIYMLIHILTIPYTHWRYRLPLDSIFIITGSFGIVETYKILRLKLAAR